jgi:hypothetical protein
MDVGDVADVMEVHAASIVRVKVCKVSEFSCI